MNWLFFAAFAASFFALGVAFTFAYMDWRVARLRAKRAKEKDCFEFTIGLMQWRKKDRERYMSSAN